MCGDSNIPQLDPGAFKCLRKQDGRFFGKEELEGTVPIYEHIGTVPSLGIYRFG